jgi:hypothetical protein
MNGQNAHCHRLFLTALKTRVNALLGTKPVPSRYPAAIPF